MQKLKTIEVEVTFAQYIGQRIKSKRNATGLAMDEFKSVISKPYLSEVEHGKRKIGYEKLYGLAQLLGVDMNWFSEGWEDD